MTSQTTIRLRVARKVAETADICRFELLPIEGEALPAFSAGAHLVVHTPGGMMRSYSLCNAPEGAKSWEIAVLREQTSRGGSKAMHERVNEGDLLTVEGPRNLFELAAGASESLLLAGGIGITPLLAMAESLYAKGRAFELHYCTRSLDRTAFLERLAARPYRAQVHHHFDDGDVTQRIDLSALLSNPSPGRHLYVCGPKGFLDAVLSTARACGWPEDRLHSEAFGAEVVHRETDGAFEVQLASSGRVISVAKEQTVVDALAAVGVEVPVSCEQGVCGTCLTRVLEGRPDHQDMYLSPQEQAANDQFLPCCSRSLTPRLVLDL